MRKALIVLAAGLAGLSAPAAAQEAPAEPDYREAATWLCLPGREDPCGRPLPVTTLGRNDFSPVARLRPARNPPIDCFYVYPTVSRDAGDNSDLVAGPEEQGVAMVQFAPFAGICRPYAPLYRQATIASLLRAIGGGAPRSLEPAYRDVAAAWRYYLEHHNRGRPFVLIGHSQGTVHLTRLLASEIEGDPAARRMLSALLIGFNVEVPENGVVGGSLQRTSLCTRPGQTGCVITYVSFRASAPPRAVSLFGRAARPGMTVGCTDPALLARRGPALDSLFYAGPSITSTQTRIAWSARRDPPAPLVRTRGLVSARCVNQGPLGYLAVTVVADPRDARTDEIPGDVMILGRVQPGWGLHLADMSLAMGDLIRAVELQRDAFRRRR